MIEVWEPKVLNSDQLGPSETFFRTLTGERVHSVAAEGLVAYHVAEDAEENDVGYLLIYLAGSGLHVGLDRQLARQLRDSLQRVLDRFPAPRHGV